MFNYPKLILFSNKDIAGGNIAKLIIEKFGFQEVEKEEKWARKDILISKVNEEILYLEEISPEIKPEICIVASRHSSKLGKPSLTAHSPGNFSKAKFGGRGRKLGIAPAFYLREALLSLEKNGKNMGYEISFEVTHHGPTQLRFPILFAEVGSTEKEWNDLKAIETVATTIFDILTNEPEKSIAAIGLGGGHYCRKFSKLAKEFALGHICPKYNLPNLDAHMLKEMISQTKPKPTYALVEKKGLGKEKQRILNLLEKTTEELEIKLV